MAPAWNSESTALISLSVQSFRWTARVSTMINENSKKNTLLLSPSWYKVDFFFIQVGSHHLLSCVKKHMTWPPKKISSTHHTTKISPRSLGEQRFRKEACKSIQGLFQSFYLHLKPRGLRWKKRFCSSLEINRYLHIYIYIEIDIDRDKYIYISNHTHVLWKNTIYIYIHIIYIIIIIYTCVSS